ncbi:haloacid dehalogenase-like hydrolase [Klebsiella variicola subsp. variicola]|nr:haloacid dehalogenase-like hydrolase [Klebsiella variicola subsp. variicola]
MGTVFTVRWWRSSGNIRRAGMTWCLSPGSMTDILWPAMAELGVEHALCSEPVVVDEHYTGNSGGPPLANIRRCMLNATRRNGASRWRRAMPLGTISRICAARAGWQPCAVNPCAALLAESQRRGWPVLWSNGG